MRGARWTLASLLLVVGCNSGGADDPEAELSGSYVGDELVVNGQATALVAGTEIRLEVAGGRLTLSAGCNAISADVEVLESSLRIAEREKTAMGCAPDRSAQDDLLVRLVDSSPAYDLTEDGLQLSGDGIVVALSAAP